MLKKQRFPTFLNAMCKKIARIVRHLEFEAEAGGIAMGTF